MKRKKSAFLCLFLAIFLLSSCRSITRNSGEMGVPPSTVIFSFDDGPNAMDDTTARVLDVLKKYEIRAMFALLGENAEANPHLVRRIHDEGHIIINHGYSDKWAAGMGEDEFRNNLVRGERAISLALEKELQPKLYRPHGGFYKTRQKNICVEEGYAMALSSVRAYDAVQTGDKQDKIIKRIIKQTEKQNGGIVLLHDARDSHSRMEKNLEKSPSGPFNRSWFPEALEEIIIALLEKGYVLNSPVDYR